MRILAGIDIGGTKCAACIGRFDWGADTHVTGGEEVVARGKPAIIARKQFLTPSSPGRTIELLVRHLEELLVDSRVHEIEAIGVSCGGPLDTGRGLVLSPPNLPNWDRIDVVTPFQDRFDVPVGLLNDANACALAEWRWGAGRGCRNLIFLTFGTGMGAGLILDGRPYSGTNDLAGEVGHIRLEHDGPIGHGKAGSFEGFCSGGGIAQLARSMAIDQLNAGLHPLYCQNADDLALVTAKRVGQAAQRGDELALEIFAIVGRQLGRGLALLVDILNPERIVIGGIYQRQRALLEPVALRILGEEALQRSFSVCEIVPPGLGERVGDFASLAVAHRMS